MGKDYSMLEKGRDVGGFGLALLAFVIVFVLAMPWTDPDGATRVLTQAGYTNVRITGARYFGGEDRYCTGFEATAPNGARVTGYVSKGVLKGSTIRLD